MAAGRSDNSPKSKLFRAGGIFWGLPVVPSPNACRGHTFGPPNQVSLPGRTISATQLEPTERMRAAAGRDHRRQPVVQTGVATSLGRQTDLPRKRIALTCEVGGFARLNHVLTHVVTVDTRTIMKSSAGVSPTHCLR